MEPPVAKRKKTDTEATRRARLDKRNEIERARRLTKSDEKAQVIDKDIHVHGDYRGNLQNNDK